jgi:hypothetical protein
VTAAVKPSTEGNVAALLVSLGLHAGLLLLPVLGRLHASAPHEPATRPNSVTMVGNSIEVEAPTSDFAAAPAAPPPAPDPVDVNALPPESTQNPEPTRISDPDAAPAPKPAPMKASSKPAPKPRPQRDPATPTEHPRPANASSAAAAGANAPTIGAPAAGTFGQEGLAPGVRRLGYAFTRAIPAATPADEAWRELPTGHVGTIRIELAVDESNHLGELKRWQARPGEPAPPAVLERMVQRTLLLLRAGQFALSGSNQPGSERLVIDVTLRDDTAEEEGSDNVVNKGFDGATPGHPGRAHFRYGNGRTFEAKVTIVSSGR